jgi:hypothetical protein
MVMPLMYKKRRRLSFWGRVKRKGHPVWAALEYGMRIAEIH